MNTLVQQHFSRAQKRMKSQADKHRSEREFAVGDWVYLKLQPYVQSSLAPRANQKLAFKFFWSISGAFLFRGIQAAPSSCIFNSSRLPRLPTQDSPSC